MSLDSIQYIPGAFYNQCHLIKKVLCLTASWYNTAFFTLQFPFLYWSLLDLIISHATSFLEGRFYFPLYYCTVEILLCSNNSNKGYLTLKLWKEKRISIIYQKKFSGHVKVKKGSRGIYAIKKKKNWPAKFKRLIIIHHAHRGLFCL